MSSAQALNDLAKLSFKATKAFELKTFLKAVEAEVKIFDETRLEKAKELGTLEGEQYKFDEEGAKKFNEEMTALGDKDIAIDVPVITKEDLGEQSVTIATLAQLDWLIK